MLRVPLGKSYIKRTIRPLYAFAQATPKSQFLDPAWDYSTPIYPGMGMVKTAGENVTLAGGTGDVPIYGLCGNYIGGDGIDEITEQGVNAMAVWVMAPDAEFEILDPAFDSTASWTDPGTGGLTLVRVYLDGVKRGKLTNVAASTTVGSKVSLNPVARLIKVNSSTKITIGGLQGTSA